MTARRQAVRRSPRKNSESEGSPSELGSVLADLRNAKGLSFRQVEEATNRAVSNAYLSQLENGKIKKPSPNVLHSLAGVYALPYQALMEKARYLRFPHETPESGARDWRPLRSTICRPRKKRSSSSIWHSSAGAHDPERKPAPYSGASGSRYAARVGVVSMNREEPSSAAAPYDVKTVGASSTGKVHVFAIFDTEHDGDLYDQLSAHARFPSCEFEVTGGSVRSRDTDVWRDRVRRGIRNADQVIVICGEHTEASAPVHAELLISQEEGTPYFLLWGRRELMCTKPIGTKSDEGMFSWTREIVHDQIALTLRNARSQASAKSLSNPARKTAGPL